MVLIGFLVACGALTLFVGGRGEQADLGFNAILIFASYPLDLFGGATKVLLFTAVPAAFVTGAAGAAGAQLRPRRGAAAGGGGGRSSRCSAGACSQLGLRRYASGSIWTR